MTILRNFIEYIKAFFSILLPLIGLGLIFISINLIIKDFRLIYTFNLCIGFVLARYGFQVPNLYDDYLLNNELKRRRQLENEIKLNGDLIHVPSNEIFIDEEVEEIIEEVNNFTVLSFIRGFNKSQNVKDYNLSTVLIYKTKIDGVYYEFISLPINRRKESILFLIGDKGFVDLYVDKRNKEIYYFDVEFLKIK